MINHLFFSSFTHLNIPIIDSFNSISKLHEFNECYIIVGNNNKDIYVNKFKELGIGRYIFIDGFFNLFYYILKNKDLCYLLHGIPYNYISCFFLSNVRNVNWVCWGAGARVNRNSIKSRMFTPIKTLLYKRFSSIIVLLNGDKESLENDFHLKNIRILPYYSENHFKLKEYFFSLLHSKKDKTEKVKVLLGNNTWCLSNYYEILKTISSSKDLIQVNCMFQYPQIPDSDKVDFVNYGKNIFGENFAIDEKMMPTIEYIDYMNQYDIYICSCDNQSGLGAISTCLKLGKKIFISGVNYEWINSQGFRVFHVSDLLSKDWLLELNDNIKNFNFSNWYATRTKLKEEWSLYLKNIIYN